MNEKELRELFCDMQMKGLSPLICDTKVPLYKTVVPCGIPTACYDDCVDSVHSNIFKRYFRRDSYLPSQ